MSPQRAEVDNQTMLEIVEVGPRDGLQNDNVMFSTDQKVEFITRVIDAGVTRVEVASFVNPKRVPQMADAEAVIAALPQRDGVSYIGLVLNARGFERAAQTALQEVNLVVACSDTFADKNQGMTAIETVGVVAEVAPLARAAGFKTSVTMSVSFGCPYEGEVSVERVVEIARRCAEAGIDELALADTIGVAVPVDVRRRVQAVREALGQDGPALRAHFHNTRNTGIASAIAAAEAGVMTLDSSLSGIGGCPFAPKATGNIPTEDLVFALDRSGIKQPSDLRKLIEASDWLSGQLGRVTPALLPKAGPFPT